MIVSVYKKYLFIVLLAGVWSCEDGADGLSGENGQDGVDGENGLSTILYTLDEPSGDNCANGGIKNESGIDDDTNGNLSSEEVDAVEYICDGGSSVSTLLRSYSIAPFSMVCNIGGNPFNF